MTRRTLFLTALAPLLGKGNPKEDLLAEARIDVEKWFDRKLAERVTARLSVEQRKVLGFA